LVGFVLFALALVASPLDVSAQPAEEDSLSSWQVEAKPAPEEPALELKLDDDSVKITPGAQRAPTVEEMEMEGRVRRARIGLAVTPVPIVIGFLLTTPPLLTIDFCLVDCPPPPTAEELAREDRLIRAGATIAVLGGASMIAMGILLGVRKRARRELKQAHYGAPRRVQWDLARSRLVF
jgi:hypothetical protein